MAKKHPENVIVYCRTGTQIKTLTHIVKRRGKLSSPTHAIQLWEETGAETRQIPHRTLDYTGWQPNTEPSCFEATALPTVSVQTF